MTIDQNNHIMKEKILVVDDEETMVFTIGQFLIREGYEVFTANDYNEALSRIDETGLDLIFADIILGEKTGIDLLREVRKRNLQCPVILITGNPEIGSAADAVRLGAYDYISKPVRKDTIIHVAKMALDHKALVNEKEEYRSNLEATFRSVKDAIITVDKELNVIAINKAAEEMFTVFGNDVKGKAFKHLCNGICLEALTSTIKTKQPVEAHRTKCGSIPGRIVSLSTSPLLDSRDNFKGCVMVVKDETRLDNLERDLQDRQKFHN
ncbi:MAG: response regulator, partial [Candidatus Anammoxibacter sp.]